MRTAADNGPDTGPPLPPLPDTAASRSRAVGAWLLWALAWAVVLAAIGYEVWRTRAGHLARDEALLQSQAQAIEQNLVRQLTGVGNALSGVRYLLTAADLPGHDEPEPPQLKLLTDAMPGVRAIQVMDADGRVVAASRRDLVGNRFDSRPYFTRARDDPDITVLHLSPPFLTIYGRYATVLSRPMRGMDGQLAGVVAAALDSEYFEIVLRAALYAPDVRATIVHGEGSIVLSVPPRDAQLNMSLNEAGSMFRQHMTSGALASVLSGRLVGSSKHRIFVTRTIAPADLRLDVPLVVRMSRRVDDVLAPWRAELVRDGVLLAAAIAASALWLAWHRHHRRLQALAERAAAEAERRSARRLSFALRGADLGLWQWCVPDDTVTASARTLEMLGYPPSDEPLAPDCWRPHFHPDDVAEVERAMSAHLRGTSPSYRVEYRQRHRDGHWVWVLAHAVVMERDEHDRPLLVVGTHLDISERKRSQHELERVNAQLEAMSLTDGLTGVANRRRFDQDLTAEWARALRQRKPLALLMIDVDHFKFYNDCLGHPAGDACLRAVAQTLSVDLRQPVEHLARYGGEEFAVLLIAADGEAGVRVAERCLQAIARAALPHPNSPVGPTITLSIGVASVVPQPDAEPTQLVQAADAALYHAKQQGRARCALFSDAQPARAPHQH